MGNAQQVKRFSHALRVLLSFKQMKRLLMCLKSLLSASCVYQPVTQTIKAASTQRGISKLLGKTTGSAEPFSCLFVITSRPEEAKCHHALPFQRASMSCARRL